MLLDISQPEKVSSALKNFSAQKDGAVSSSIPGIPL
jgi:hypothetical protein